ncbi:MAG: signal peptidase II [Velocimicrobium sp.]
MRYIIGILSIFFGDGLIKKYIDENKTFSQEEEILNGTITLTKYHNKGAMLNFMQKRPEWVLRISFAGLCAAIIYFLQVIAKGSNILLKIGMTLLVGGGLSNLYDRIKKGYVVDYFIINFRKLKNIIFNLSDFMIFIGGALVLIGAMVEDRKTK